MEKRIIMIALLVAGVSGSLNAFDRVQQYTSQAQNPSASQFYADKLAAKGQAGQALSTQLQTAEGQAQQSLQNTGAMQKFQNVSSRAQNPGSGLTSRFGGGKFF